MVKVHPLKCKLDLRPRAIELCCYCVVDQFVLENNLRNFYLIIKSLFNGIFKFIFFKQFQNRERENGSGKQVIKASYTFIPSSHIINKLSHVKHSNMDTDITQDGFAFQVLFKIKWETMKQIISRANSTNLWYICYTHLSVINIYSLIKLNYLSLYIQSNLSTSATLGTWKIWSLCWGSSEKDQW